MAVLCSSPRRSALTARAVAVLFVFCSSSCRFLMNNHPQKNPPAGSSASSSNAVPSNGSPSFPPQPQASHGLHVPGRTNPPPHSGGARMSGMQLPPNHRHAQLQGMMQSQGIHHSLVGGRSQRPMQGEPQLGPYNIQGPQGAQAPFSHQHSSQPQTQSRQQHPGSMMGRLPGHAQQASASAGRPQGAGWGVPNPLASGGNPHQTSMASFGVPQGQQQRTSGVGQHVGAGTASAQYIYSRPASGSSSVASRQISASAGSTATSGRRPAYTVNRASHSGSGGQSSKPRVVLSPEARKALANAIWSAIRSPTGTIDPDALNAALATGLPRQAVVNAARVAREREAQKKALVEQQQLAARQQVVRGLSVTSKMPQQSSRAPTGHMTRSTYTPQSATLAPPQRVAEMTKARMEERANWKRVQSGVLMVQKGRFLAVPYSVGAVVRSKDMSVALSTPTRKRSKAGMLLEASRLQKALRQAKEKAISEPLPPVLLDPEKFKRVKIEPKRTAKALDRAMRKSRAATAEALVKQHKELAKAISSHQTEFFKYHRQRKADAHRLAKIIRDGLDKEEKKKEKEADQAERARLAALRSNDMAAYSKLLEDTKNERLKFLLGKTDECITQISAMLQRRSDEDRNAAEFSTASAASTGSYYASAHLKMEDVRQPTILVGGELKEYQVAGLQWMVSLYNNKLNGILADEMGLGKTIQAISLISYLMEFKNNLGPFLIIVPLSTLSNWQNEFQKWCPSARVITYKGTPQQRKELYREEVRTGQFNVLLTTYEYIIKDKASLRKIMWQYAIVDEGHRMKNAQSKFAVTLSTMYSTNNRILLTGTPLQNNLPELWALLNFLLPTIFNSVESFDQWFNRPFANYGNTSAAEEDTDQMLTNEERMLIIHRLHELLRPFMLRRVKSEVLDQLPEKVEKVIRCELSSWQKELYKQISAKATADKSILGTGYVEPQQPARGLNNVVMQLRKVCNHPFLFSPEGYHVDDNLIRSSAKFHLLDQMLPKLKAGGHRVLMFTQMTAVMTILEDYFAYRGYSALRLDGSTPAEEREKRMYQFNAPDSPYFIFLLSTRAGGLGLNLATANIVIIFDSDWNPMMDLQAQDRAHRIGQRSDVSVFRLVTNSPVEEKILSRATEKLNMSELVVEAGKFDKSSVENDNSLERKRMMEVLLTDFETTTSNFKGVEADEVSESENADVDADTSATDNENLNELLSNNEADFELYSEIDNTTSTTHLHLHVSPDDVPDWIKNPARPANKSSNALAPIGDSRKRKAVAYDDGLTEKQFLRLMEKQAKAEESEANKHKRKRAKLSVSEPTSDVVMGSAEPSNDEAVAPGVLTEWTFRKLISSTKVVIALKDPTTKRRLSEIFLEKPDAAIYPDYYQMIERPIAINDILRKCRGHLYSDVQEFRDDWKQLFANAVKFNGSDSWVSQDAMSLEKELDRIMKKNGFNEAPPPPKRKPLRIKLSLKKLKKTSDAEAPKEGGAEETSTQSKFKKVSSQKKKTAKK